MANYIFEQFNLYSHTGVHFHILLWHENEGYGISDIYNGFKEGNEMEKLVKNVKTPVCSQKKSFMLYRKNSTICSSSFLPQNGSYNKMYRYAAQLNYSVTWLMAIVNCNIDFDIDLFVLPFHQDQLNLSFVKVNP